ncbi:MAG TPA: copper-binding protein [Noviherbaspirillum sp.]|uniref:copper-binding protein n=1 Tax=Noviherbaspirillum sp. TaxID=1926288 RepID=UPI002B45CEC5|nr:copper-binding protein [Noviherbaspirillum sp.]HJV85334.1 copper-binding protein [Noviherbaspirillum sp.]
MKQLSRLALLSACALAFTAPAFAANEHNHMHDHGAMVMPVAAKASAMTEGEIKKVDKEAGKITIKHGPIENLGMPNMTMVFRAKDPAMLDQVKQGDKVRFTADKVNGALTVTKLEVAK